MNNIVFGCVLRYNHHWATDAHDYGICGEVTKNTKPIEIHWILFSIENIDWIFSWIFSQIR